MFPSKETFPPVHHVSPYPEPRKISFAFCGDRYPLPAFQFVDKHPYSVSLSAENAPQKTGGCVDGFLTSVRQERIKNCTPVIGLIIRIHQRRGREPIEKNFEPILRFCKLRECRHHPTARKGVVLWRCGVKVLIGVVLLDLLFPLMWSMRLRWLFFQEATQRFGFQEFTWGRNEDVSTGR